MLIYFQRQRNPRSWLILTSISFKYLVLSSCIRFSIFIEHHKCHYWYPLVRTLITASHLFPPKFKHLHKLFFPKDVMCQLQKPIFIYPYYAKIIYGLLVHPTGIKTVSRQGFMVVHRPIIKESCPCRKTF